MKVMLNQIDDHDAIQILLKDLVDRNKEVRNDLILDRIKTTIAEKWLNFVYETRCWLRPVKCIVKFRLNDENGAVLPNSGFALEAEVKNIASDSLENYGALIGLALNSLGSELRKKCSLDDVEFDMVNGQEAIEFFEYHDVLEGF